MLRIEAPAILPQKILIGSARERSLPGEMHDIAGLLHERTRCANIDASGASAKGVLHMGMLDELLGGGQIQKRIPGFR